MIEFRQDMGHQQDSIEEKWTMEYELYEADLAFLRSRIGAVIRNITRWTRALSPDPVPDAEKSQIRSVSLDSIAGVVDERGQRTHGIPMLRRAMADGWRRMFREADHDSHLPLSVVAGRNGWYLVGGPGALLTLEVLRARGGRLIPVRTLSVRELRRCTDTEENDDCLGAA
jgi:hypothetical protein